MIGILLFYLRDVMASNRRTRERLGGLLAGMGRRPAPGRAARWLL